MEDKKKFILGIILARAGSKRLPDKNIKLLNGKPLMSYIIETALNVKELDDVILSTESEKYAHIGKKYGMTVPFFRPEKLASDSAESYEVVEHAVNEFEKKYNVNVDIIVLLQTTTPTTTENDIKKCIDLVKNKKMDSAITVFKVNDRPEWCGIIKENEFKKYFDENKTKKMSKIDWHMPSGGVYAAYKNAYFKYKSFYTPKCGTVIIPPERNTDIDTIMDFKFAEFLLTK